MTVTIEFPLTLINPTNRREHWGARQRRAKAQRAATALMLRSRRTLLEHVEASQMAGGLAQPKHIAVHLIRVAPRRLDDDGAVASLKSVRDEVAAYFGLDDADPRIRFTYEQAKGKAAVRIELRVEAPGGDVR